MEHLRDETEAEINQLKATIKEQEDMLGEKANQIGDLSVERDMLQGELKTKGDGVERLTRSLDAIHRSHGWKVLSICYRVRDRLLGISSFLRLRRDNRLVAESGHFDSEWYLRQNPDVAAAGLNPLEHYLRQGAFEGRDPNPQFDSDRYLQQHPEVVKSGENPLEHYLRSVVTPAVPAKGVNRLSRKSAENKVSSRPGERPTIVPRIIPGAAPTARLARGDANRRLICVSHVLPYPPRAGNEYRIHRILTWLSGQGFDVFLIVCPLPGESITARMLVDACSVYPNLIVCQRDGTLSYRLEEGEIFVKKLAGVRPRAFAALLGEEDNSPVSPKVLSMTRTFCPDLLAEVLQQLDLMLEPRILWVNYVWMTRALPLMRAKVLKVVDTHDVFSTKREKVTQFGIEDPCALTTEEEKQLLNRADLVVSIQSGEEEELRRIAPRKRIVTAGVDFDPIDRTSVSVQAPLILLVASDNALNVKGLTDFLRFAWPIICRDVVGAQLRVVGGVGAQMELDDPTVRFMGRIDDLAIAYAEARVVINPSVAGTGLKIKTVEAIFHLRPIVCWPSGVEGIEPDLQALCHIAKDWHSFARHVIDLCNREESEDALLGQGNQIRKQLSSDIVYRALGKSLSELLAESRCSPQAVGSDAHNRVDGDR